MGRSGLIDSDLQPPKEGDMVLRICFGHDNRQDRPALISDRYGQPEKNTENRDPQRAS